MLGVGTGWTALFRINLLPLAPHLLFISVGVAMGVIEDVSPHPQCLRELVFFYRFWGMLSYLANTLIFVLVGVVIAQRAFSGVEDNDWIALTSLYFAINVIR